METCLQENNVAVKSKPSSEEALARWIQMCCHVMNPRRRFRFIVNLAKNFDQLNMQGTDQYLLNFHSHSAAADIILEVDSGNEILNCDNSVNGHRLNSSDAGIGQPGIERTFRIDGPPANKKRAVPVPRLPHIVGSGEGQMYATLPLQAERLFPPANTVENDSLQNMDYQRIVTSTAYVSEETQTRKHALKVFLVIGIAVGSFGGGGTYAFMGNNNRNSRDHIERVLYWCSNVFFGVGVVFAVALVGRVGWISCNDTPLTAGAIVNLKYAFLAAASLVFFGYCLAVGFLFERP